MQNHKVSVLLALGAPQNIPSLPVRQFEVNGYGLSMCYKIELTSCINSKHEPQKLLGCSGCFQITEGNSQCIFRGYIASIHQQHYDGAESSLIIIHLWAPLLILTYRSKNRIFRDKSLKEILQNILKPTADRLRLKISLKNKMKIPLIRQYSESDYEFLHKLLKKFQLFYVYVNTQKGLTLLVCDHTIIIDRLSATQTIMPCAERTIQWRSHPKPSDSDTQRPIKKNTKGYGPNIKPAGLNLNTSDSITMQAQSLYQIWDRLQRHHSTLTSGTWRVINIQIRGFGDETLLYAHRLQATLTLCQKNKEPSPKIATDSQPARLELGIIKSYQADDASYQVMLVNTHHQAVTANALSFDAGDHHGAQFTLSQGSKVITSYNDETQQTIILGVLNAKPRKENSHCLTNLDGDGIYFNDFASSLEVRCNKGANRILLNDVGHANLSIFSDQHNDIRTARSCTVYSNGNYTMRSLDSNHQNHSDNLLLKTSYGIVKIQAAHNIQLHADSSLKMSIKQTFSLTSSRKTVIQSNTVTFRSESIALSAQHGVITLQSAANIQIATNDFTIHQGEYFLRVSNSGDIEIYAKRIVLLNETVFMKANMMTIQESP